MLALPQPLIALQALAEAIAWGVTLRLNKQPLLPEHRWGRFLPWWFGLEAVIHAAHPFGPPGPGSVRTTVIAVAVIATLLTAMPVSSLLERQRRRRRGQGSPT